MGLHEPVIVPAGYDLCVEGLGENTCREIARPRSWRGLSVEDCALLRAWVEELGDALEELHTNVRVGVVPDLPEGTEYQFVRRERDALYPLRIDGCLRIRGVWKVCEVKPDAGYLSLGQILTYHYFAKRTCSALAESGAVVLTDMVQESLRPVFSHYGVEVVEVGEVPVP